MDSATRPLPAKIGKNLTFVQSASNVSFGPSGIDKFMKYPLDDFDFGWRTRNQDYSVGLNALVLASRQQALSCAGLIYELTPQAITGRAALSVAQFD
jgi:hypothetical protein